MVVDVAAKGVVALGGGCVVGGGEALYVSPGWRYAGCCVEEGGMIRGS